MLALASDEAIDKVERLYREDGKRLWRAVLAYSRNSEIASDATAEAFAQAIARGPELRSPRAWVWTVAFRVARAQMKSRGFEDLTPSSSLVHEEGPRKLDLVMAMRHLSPKERASILLHYYADYSVKDVARIIGSSSGSVRVHLSRARRKLKRILGEGYE